MKRKPYRPNPYIVHAPKNQALALEKSGRSSANYSNSGYWFLALIVLVAAGFYTTYLSKITETQPAVVHFHFVLMALWIAMLITQPFLIKYKKLSLHRMVGRLSYGVVPLTLLSGFLMLRYAYYHFIDEATLHASQGGVQLSADELRRQAAGYVAIVVFWLAMFAVFYTLAIINRKKTPAHARYMVAAALSLLGPTIDRIVVFVVGLEKLPAGLPIEIVAFFVANTVLAVLLWKDYRAKRATATLRNSLLIYLLGQALYFTLPKMVVWGYIMAFMMQPKP
ncbi:hypothetical protein GCM10023189_51730 [Nibrella saemangeumensis]|uniref:DUF4153 domain-containing protein n=1 Tax=Nibrella saemangeumensis TaxID=1084526 RepID=A0ABP8NL80_9BACT